MGERIKIREIKKAIEINRGLANLAEKPEAGYIKKESEWGIYDASLEDFGENFNRVLPNNEIWGQYIEETLSKGKGNDLTAIEFGGSGSKLFSGFTHNFFKKTVGVCLKDIRTKNQKELDTENNHRVVTGDIMEVLDNKLLEEVVKTLGTDKTDLIISRMLGPIQFINLNPAILDRIIRNWYSMLNENGLMFIQFSNGRSTYDSPGQLTEMMVDKWLTVIKGKFPEVDIQVKLDDGILRLHKKEGAPEKLPPATQF